MNLKPIFSSLIFLFFLISINSAAQDSNYQIKKKEQTLTGLIIDSESGKPIPHTEVFVSGTTSGCITNNIGEFILKLPFVPCTLVANHVSYESFITVIRTNGGNLNITLTPSNLSIREVTVKSKNKRKQNLRFFYSHFIRNNQDDIKILNDSVLNFKRNNTSFIAFTYEPLIIVNNHLGYRVKALIKEFLVYNVNKPNGPKLPLKSYSKGEIMKLSGYYYYDSLEGSDLRKNEKYSKNRRLNYHGSYRHFLKAIYDNETGEQGYFIKSYPEKNEDIGIKRLKNTRNYFIESDSLRITFCLDGAKRPISNDQITNRQYYFTRKSTIFPGKGMFQIRKNGTSPNINFTINGPLAPQSFTNSLPEDYIPPLK